MQKIEFYFDPSCPWCWITSRWLIQVQAHRDVEVSWRPFSLAMKNGELEGDSGATPHAVPHNQAHRVLRVIEVIVGDGVQSREVLYTAFGKEHFINGSAYSDESISEVLDELGLSADYLSAADESSIDQDIQAHLNSAIAVVGEDVGVPTIIFENDSGEKTGFFGPVITELPSEEESLKLWDGLSALASNTSFYELKRSRSVGPSVETTKVLFEN